ncbi:MAG: ArsR family transcriptional regulator [Thaumarchaeota archaeon]|nr:ArsR family transcriptional regulator [Nitrososphaerota archaeon]MBI3116933.1 ArsR family transcriptional regulator [Nitrososphaerota archaeon]
MRTVEEPDLDSILLTVENPIRRKLIRRLSEEPSYQLQLSKELGFSQQLVAKHLDSMEDVGVVASLLEDSPHGPRRKEYLLNKSISLSVDFAPNLFRARVMSFDTLQEGQEHSFPAHDLMPRMRDALKRPEESRLGSLGTLVGEIDKRLFALDDERSVLLYLRHLTMKEVSKVIAGLKMSPEKKKVLYHVLDEHNKDAAVISNTLKLAEDFVRRVLAELNRDLQL